MTIQSVAMTNLYNALHNCIYETHHVFLVYRFNKDDSKVGGMFSAPYKEDREKVIQGVKPMNVMKYQIKSDKSFKRVEIANLAVKSALKSVAKSDKQGGGHAEEFFLQFFLAERHRTKITSVDIMLSRIPCEHVSSPWYLGGQGPDLPAGCGPKLLKVVKTYRDINWVITYDEIKGNSFQSVGDLDKENNCRCYKV